MSDSLSVVVAYHRGRHFIDRCLSSIWRVLPGAEILVVENGSNELSLQDLSIADLADVKLLHIEIANKCTARNKGAEIASRPLVTFLDQDDEILNGIESSLGQLKDPGIDAVIATQAFDQSESAYIPPYFRESIDAGRHMYHPMTIVTRRESFFEVGGFDESLHLAEDFNLIARYRKHHKTIALNKEASIMRHFHDDNDSRSVNAARAELFQVLRESSRVFKPEK